MKPSAIVRRAKKRLKLSTDKHIQNELIKYLFFYQHSDNGNPIVLEKLKLYGSTSSYDEQVDNQMAMIQ